MKHSHWWMPLVALHNDHEWNIYVYSHYFNRNNKSVNDTTYNIAIDLVFSILQHLNSPSSHPNLVPSILANSHTLNKTSNACQLWSHIRHSCIVYSYRNLIPIPQRHNTSCIFPSNNTNKQCNTDRISFKFNIAVFLPIANRNPPNTKLLRFKI